MFLDFVFIFTLAGLCSFMKQNEAMFARFWFRIFEWRKTEEVSSVIQDSKLPVQSIWNSLYCMVIFSGRKSQRILDILLLEVLVIFNIICFNSLFFPAYNKPARSSNLGINCQCSWKILRSFFCVSTLSLPA